MSALVPLLVALPLLGAAVTLVFGRNARLQVFVTVATLAIVSVIAADEQQERRRIPRIMTVATAGMVGVTVALTVFAGPLYALCDRIGAVLLEPVNLVQLEGEVEG